MGAENRTAAKIVALLAKRRSQRLRQGNGKSARIYELWRRSLESGPKTTSGKTARLSGRHGARLPADRKPEAKNAEGKTSKRNSDWSTSWRPPLASEKTETKQVGAWPGFAHENGPGPSSKLRPRSERNSAPDSGRRRR
jgi:hypothetical protein